MFSGTMIGGLLIHAFLFIFSVDAKTILITKSVHLTALEKITYL